MRIRSYSVSGAHQACILLFLLSQPFPVQSASLVPLAPENTPPSASGHSESPLISDDGRYVVFTSSAEDLVTNDSNQARDVFIHDRQLRSTRLISIDPNRNSSGNGPSHTPDMTPDGRYVVFQSQATNLVAPGSLPPDAGYRRSMIYRADLLSGETRLINVNVPERNFGIEAAPPLTNIWYSLRNPVISDDGMNVLYETGARHTDDPLKIIQGWDYPEWLPVGIAHPDRPDDLFLWNENTGLSERITVSINAGLNNPASYFTEEKRNAPAMDFSGRFVVFSRATRNFDIALNQRIQFSQNVIILDRQSATNIVPNYNPDSGFGSLYSFVRGLSEDGTWLLWEKRSRILGHHNLVQNDNLHLRNLFTGDNLIVSSNHTAGVSADDFSELGALSANGDWVAYFSAAGNLVDQDVNAQVDLFLFNRPNRTTTRVSTHSSWNGWLAFSAEQPPVISPNGDFVLYQAVGSGLFLYDRQADSNTLITTDVETDTPAMTPDGRHVVFTALPSTFDPSDTNPNRQVYHYDVATEEVSLISIRAQGLVPSTPLGGVILATEGLSADGRFITFSDSDGHVWVRDTQLGTNLLVSVDHNGNPLESGLTQFRDLQLSADGQLLCFSTTTRNLVEGDNDFYENVFVRDLVAGETFRTQHDSGSSEAETFDSIDPVMSRDGSKVIFQSTGQELAGGGSFFDLFMLDVATREVSLLTTNLSGTGGVSTFCDLYEISDDGRYVAFRTSASDFFQLDPPTSYQAYLIDTHTWERFHLNQDGMGNRLFGAGVTYLSMSPSGEFVVMRSNYDPEPHPAAWYDHAAGFARWLPEMVLSTNLIFDRALAADNGTVAHMEKGQFNQSQVRLTDPETGASIHVSRALTGVNESTSSARLKSVSGDGRYVLFSSFAPDLYLDDRNQHSDLFLCDTAARSSILLSLHADGSRTASGFTGKGVLTDDGKKVIFESFAHDLTNDDYNQERDIFVATIFSGDTDGDQLPDNWELAHFGNLDQNAATNHDGDAFSDGAEFKAGTSPIHSASVLSPVILESITGSGATIIWPSVPGIRYQVQYKDAVDDPTWSSLPGVVAAQTSTSTKVDESASLESNRFYRVMVVE